MAVIYVDEAGNEGFTRTSLEWFVLGGAMHSNTTFRACMDRFDAFKAEYKSPDWFFHFQKRTHDERLGFIIWMSAAPFQAFAVAVHKPSILKPDNFRKKYWLYFYALRFMLEKATDWAATHANEPMGIILSSRRGLKKENLQEYFSRIRNSPFVTQDRIVWSHLLDGEIHVRPNREFRGLQMADCLASSIFKAVEPSEYGTTECRYIRELRPLFDNHPLSLRSCTKLWPIPSQQICEEPRLDWLFRA